MWEGHFSPIKSKLHKLLSSIYAKYLLCCLDMGSKICLLVYSLVKKGARFTLYVTSCYFLLNVVILVMGMGEIALHCVITAELNYVI